MMLRQLPQYGARRSPKERVSQRCETRYRAPSTPPAESATVARRAKAPCPLPRRRLPGQGKMTRDAGSAPAARKVLPVRQPKRECGGQWRSRQNLSATPGDHQLDMAAARSLQAGSIRRDAPVPPHMVAFWPLSTKAQAARWPSAQIWGPGRRRRSRWPQMTRPGSAATPGRLHQQKAKRCRR